MNNKLKLATLLLFVTVAANIANAQDFLDKSYKSYRDKPLSRIGLKGGVTFANSTYKNNGNVDNSSLLTTFNAGVVADLGLSKVFFIRTGLDFQSKGIKYNVAGSDKHTYKSNPLYLELPVNFVFKAPLSETVKFYFGAGPYLACGIGGKQSDSYTNGNVTTTTSTTIKFSNDNLSGNNGSVWEGAQYKRFDVGANILAGLELGRVAFNVQYGIGLFNTVPGTSNNLNNQINEHRVFSADFIIFL